MDHFVKHRTKLVGGIVATLLSLNAGVVPAPAQPSATIPKVGVLATADTGPTVAFRQGLRDLGFVEGQTIDLQYRFSEARPERLPGLAGELVALKPDVLVALGAVSARALKAATSTIPIVFAINPDAVEVGLVKDNARPEGNLTGFTAVDPQQYTTQLQLLKEIVPGAKRVAFLADQDLADTMRRGAYPVGQKEADATGLALQGIGLRASQLDLEKTFQMVKDGKADALLVLQQPITGLNVRAIADLAITNRLPTMFYADAVNDAWQGLAAYGSSLSGAAASVPSYVAQILKGAKPETLPVRAARRQTFVINLDTAQKIGLTIPDSVLQKVDKVIGSRAPAAMPAGRR